MSEVLLEGPLDKVRRINADAADFDVMVDALCEVDGVTRDEINYELALLNQGHPYLGREVEVTGLKMTTSMDEEGNMHAQSMPPDQEKFTQSGIYAGYTLVTPYDPHSEEKFYRVAHTLDLYQQTYLDEFGNKRSTTYRAYIFADESEIYPSDPIDAHSFKDLKDDPEIEEINVFAFDERMDRATILRRIAYVANGFLRKEWDTLENLQRISYINSLGLLDEGIIYARDMVVPNAIDQNGNTCGLYTPTNELHRLRPYGFTIAQKYFRKPQGIVGADRVELFIEGVQDAGYMALVSAKNTLLLK